MLQLSRPYTCPCQAAIEQEGKQVVVGNMPVMRPGAENQAGRLPARVILGVQALGFIPFRIATLQAKGHVLFV